ncbi:hypothetical protein Mapa_011446 [Marchantia paleacea]|nr:hypothetical protein Mapa_011446 [Marchantia paleacea]
MFGRREEHVSFTFDDRYEEKHRTTKRQECSMCGDVGFPDQLQQCTRCRFRFQHTYCCNSKEGLGTGAWMCDWCQLAKEEARSDRASHPVSAAPSTMSSGESGALEFLLKAALTEAGVDAAGVQSSSVDGGSFCSSSIESVKGDEVSYGDPGDASCSNRERMSEGDEATTTFPCSGHPDNGGCDPKRNPKLLRCSSKTSQKRRHRSLLEQQCGSVQLKRLSSLKGGKSGIACDPPKSFVRRYKSLSDISF